MSNGISANAQPTDSFATIPDVPVAPTTDRVSPNQMAIGNTRGAIITPGSDGKPQVLQGNQQKFGNGLFVTKPGFDVTTNTDPANFIFNSNQNTFKIVQSGPAQLNTIFPTRSGPLSSQTEVVSVTIPHNLGYAPAALVYCSNSGGAEYFAISDGGIWAIDFSPNYSDMYSHGVSTTNSLLTISLYRDYWVNTGTTLGNRNGFLIYKYYLLQETAN